MSELKTTILYRRPTHFCCARHTRMSTHTSPTPTPILITYISHACPCGALGDYHYFEYFPFSLQGEYSGSLDAAFAGEDAALPMELSDMIALIDAA